MGLERGKGEGAMRLSLEQADMACDASEKTGDIIFSGLNPDKI